MTSPYSGRCSCGKVTLAISGEPLMTRQCWCRQCQQIASGGATQNAIFRTEDVTIEGVLATASYVAASGNTLRQLFCPSCGCHVYAQSSARPHLRTVRFGVIDEPHGLAPQMAIWTDDAPEWAVIDVRLERYSRQPPPPPIPE